VKKKKNKYYRQARFLEMYVTPAKNIVVFFVDSCPLRDEKEAVGHELIN
jgi:hypothetical protein